MKGALTTVGYKKAAEVFLGLKTPSQLADLLKINLGELIMATRDGRYTRLQIGGAGGRPRKVFQPDRELKAIQRRLNHYLQSVYLCVKPDCVYGFVKNPADARVRHTIVTHARNHVGKRYVINADIFRFFPSIKGDAVREVFLGAPFHFDLQLASAVALLCLCRNWLPTGAPTSPVISNLVCVGLDRDLEVLARKYGYAYTRYADDLTFSGDVHPEEGGRGVITAEHGERGVPVGSDLPHQPPERLPELPDDGSPMGGDFMEGDDSLEAMSGAGMGINKENGIPGIENRFSSAAEKLQGQPDEANMPDEDWGNFLKTNEGATALEGNHRVLSGVVDDAITHSRDSGGSSLPSGVPVKGESGEFRAELESILLRHGFQLNRKKYRVQSRRSRQTVTGLVVNDKVNVSRDYRRRLRAIRHDATVRGTWKAAATFFGRPELTGREVDWFLDIIEGRTKFVAGVRGEGMVDYIGIFFNLQFVNEYS